MQELDSNQKYGWLVAQYDAATVAAQTLLARLRAENSTASTSLSASGFIESTSGNGKGVTFDNQSQGLLGKLCGEMLRLYESSSEGLVNSGIASPTELQIYNEMKDRLRPIRSTRTDFTYMREACA